MKTLREQGYRKAKIKIGTTSLAQDLKRIEAAQKVFDGAACLAVDAMNSYDLDRGLEAAKALSSFGLMWLEDVCDPLDFETQSAVTAVYANPIAAGEALFSVAEAKLLDRHGGPRDRDILFDPVHCHGLTGYLQLSALEAAAGRAVRLAPWRHLSLACRERAGPRRYRSQSTELPALRRSCRWRRRGRWADGANRCAGHRLRAESRSDRLVRTAVSVRPCGSRRRCRSLPGSCRGRRSRGGWRSRRSTRQGRRCAAPRRCRTRRRSGRSRDGPRPDGCSR